MTAGDLQIMKMVTNGAAVKAGDVVVEFDGASLQRTIMEKQSELRQATEELQQLKSQTEIGTESDRTALQHARFDVDRAKLGVVEEDFVAKVESQKAKLLLDDASQRLREAEVKDAANRKAADTGFGAQKSKIAKIQADLDKAQKSLEALQIKVPTDGIVSLMYNWQNSMNTPQEYRSGDKCGPVRKSWSCRICRRCC